MAIPMTGKATVFDAITASTTTELHTVAGFGGNLQFGSTILVEVVGAAATTWTLDFQGKVHPSDTYTNLDFQQIWQAGASATSTSQLSITDATRRYYVIRNAPQFVQFVSALTVGAGALTVRASLTSEPFTQDLLTTVRGSIFAEGPIAENTAIAGNPVVAGGEARADPSAITNLTAGAVARAKTDLKGVFWSRPLSAGTLGNAAAAGSAATFADADGSTLRPFGVSPFLYNGATTDTQRANWEATVFASAARTATANSADQTNHNGRSIKFVLDITAASGTTPTLDVKIQGKDTLSGTYQDITGAAFAQKTGVSTDDLTIALGVTVVANRSVSNVVPRIFRAVATIGGTTPSFTFSLSANIIN